MSTNQELLNLVSQLLQRVDDLSNRLQATTPEVKVKAVRKQRTPKATTSAPKTVAPKNYDTFKPGDIVIGCYARMEHFYEIISNNNKGVLTMKQAPSTSANGDPWCPHEVVALPTDPNHPYYTETDADDIYTMKLRRNGYEYNGKRGDRVIGLPMVIRAAGPQSVINIQWMLNN